MSWFRLDDNGADHPKVVSAGNEAYGAWVRVGQWSSRYLTDGVIPMDVALRYAPRRIWERLVRVGLCDEIRSVPAGSDKSEISIEVVTLHDFLDYNPTAKSVKEERARKAKNMANSRTRKKEQRPVTGGVTGNMPDLLPGVLPACSHGPIPYPIPIPIPERRSGVSPQTPTAAPAIHGPIPPIDQKPPERLGELPRASGSQTCLPGCQNDSEGQPRPRKRASRVKAEVVTPEVEPIGYREVVSAYFEAFEGARGTKPVFRAREGSAVKQLLASVGKERACELIRSVYKGWWKDKVGINEIAANPDKHTGARSQRESTSDYLLRRIAEEEEKERAAT